MKLKEKERAVTLRARGYSLKEISKILIISKSTASLWLRNITLSKKAKKRLLSQILKGQYISAENKKLATKELKNKIKLDAINELRS